MKYLKKLNEKNYNFKGVDKVKLYLFIFIAGAFAGYIYEVIFELIESGFTCLWCWCSVFKFYS